MALAGELDGSSSADPRTCSRKNDDRHGASLPSLEAARVLELLTRASVMRPSGPRPCSLDARAPRSVRRVLCGSFVVRNSLQPRLPEPEELLERAPVPHAQSRQHGGAQCCGLG